MKGLWVGLVGCGALLGACGDDGDQQAACDREQKLTDQIADHAENVDRISAKGVCVGTEANIADRLKQGSVWSTASDADVAERAHEYFVNCQKVAKAKAECGD